MIGMSLLVRDEMDVLPAQVAFHRREGVDVFCVTDNGSVDGTREFLAEQEGKDFLVVDEPGDNYDQGTWVTRMALMLRERGADWVMHSDADEFWKIKGGLREVPSRGGTVLGCARKNVLPVRRGMETPGVFFKNKVRVMRPLPREGVYVGCETESQFLYEVMPKVITRTRGLIRVHEGNHDCDIGRKVRENVDGIIWHFPIRRYEQFLRKVKQGGESLVKNPEFTKVAGWHWVRWYEILQKGSLEGEFMRLVPDEKESELWVSRGVAEIGEVEGLI